MREAVLDHWHPVLWSRELRRRPVRVQLAGRSVAVFRTDHGVGALDDACPHRGMSLSRGRVEGGCLVCPYHGYAFGPDGVGTSPGQPRRRLEAPGVFDAVERDGAVWIKRAGRPARFPSYGQSGLVPVTHLRARVSAPLELVLDNFCEVEHTPTTHLLLGYSLEAMADVESRLELTETTVRVVNVGQQKRIPGPVRRLVGFEAGDAFVDDWTTWFSPVHSVYHHYWRDPATGVPRPDRLVTAVFFNPLDADTTELMIFVHACGDGVESPLKRALLRPLVHAVTWEEVRRDKRIIEGLADKRTGLRGRKLSRFDKALMENRARLERIYYGAGAGEGDGAGAEPG